MLIDAALSPRLVEQLRAHGIEAVHVRDLGLADKAAAAILQKAVEEQLVVVSRDADFAALLAHGQQAWPSFVHLRVSRLNDPGAQAELLVSVLERCADELEKGAIVSVQPDRIRVRGLPLP